MRAHPLYKHSVCVCICVSVCLCVSLCVSVWCIMCVPVHVYAVIACVWMEVRGQSQASVGNWSLPIWLGWPVSRP